MFISEKCKNGCFYPTPASNSEIRDNGCIKCGHYKEKLFTIIDANPGTISKTMGVDTKPSKKLEYKGYWILVDGNISELAFEELKQKIKI